MGRGIIATLSVLTLLLVSVEAQTSPDLTSQFQALREAISSAPFSSAEQQHLNDLLDIAEEHSSNSSTRFYTTGNLLDAFVAQFVGLIFELFASSPEESGTEITPLQTEEEIDQLLEQLLSNAESIKAALYFPAPEPALMFSPETPPPPDGECSVTILFLFAGSVLGDPGGKLYARFGESVQLQAQALPAGGTFLWNMTPPDPESPFSSEANRFQFLPIETITFEVVASYTGPQGEQCEDVLWVKSQGRLEE